ncbi:hypothetical protein SEA_BRUHMOMENT_85 [Arthrobacter phage BruhMoment]|nr:hypothetical protein SEA_BRUHMOMENT_85 [Arthrobacter phage BruhMoment]
MADTPTVAEPIFYETLAAEARCTKADAVEHFEVIEHNDHGFGRHAVERFLEEFAA